MPNDVIESAQVTPPTNPESQSENVVKPEAASDVPPVVNTETPTNSDPASTPEGESTNDEGQPSNDRRSRAQERIEDLVAERNAAKEYAEFWRNKALEVIQPPAQQTPQPQPEEVIPDEPPTLEDVGFDQKRWSQEMAKWNKAQVAKQVAQTLSAQRAQSEQEAITSTFQERVETFKKDHPDFDLVLSNPRLPRLDRMAAAMIVGSEVGPDISFALAKNPDMAVKISRMNSTQQALAIGRLESDIARAKEATMKPTNPPVAEPPKAKPAPVVTKAPEPPTPIPAGAAPAPDPASMDTREWMKMRVQEARDRRRRF